MDKVKTLIQASAKTGQWVRLLCRLLPLHVYRESKYWATFGRKGASYARLNPSKKRVRLFLPLNPDDEPRLQPSPSSGNWAKRFPSIFEISSEHDLPYASALIAKAQRLSSPDSGSRVPPESRILREEFLSAEELAAHQPYFEGAAESVVVNRYERNRKARDACLRNRGINCIICDFNFESRYGEAVAGYIQVHHVVPLASIGKRYKLNPTKDLVPVCPNCHAVIHRREPPFDIEEMRQMLRDPTQL